MRLFAVAAAAAALPLLLTAFAASPTLSHPLPVPALNPVTDKQAAAAAAARRNTLLLRREPVAHADPVWPERPSLEAEDDSDLDALSANSEAHGLFRRGKKAPTGSTSKGPAAKKKGYSKKVGPPKPTVVFKPTKPAFGPPTRAEAAHNAAKARIGRDPAAKANWKKVKEHVLKPPKQGKKLSGGHYRDANWDAKVNGVADKKADGTPAVKKVSSKDGIQHMEIGLQGGKNTKQKTVFDGKQYSQNEAKSAFKQSFAHALDNPKATESTVHVDGKPPITMVYQKHPATGHVTSTYPKKP
ncbi:hypothetical protein DFJ73DRAFT_854866 [Zopfochytrium polystomum]|nr:hypothetical protein DFJ73DRAFT_854866 [Zopfochytrium polystomum]